MIRIRSSKAIVRMKRAMSIKSAFLRKEMLSSNNESLDIWTTDKNCA